MPLAAHVACTLVISLHQYCQRNNMQRLRAGLGLEQALKSSFAISLCSVLVVAWFFLLVSGWLGRLVVVGMSLSLPMLIV